MIGIRIVLVFTLISQVISTGIPIWELLTHQEKMGNLTFLFLDLVHNYCKKSDIPSCERVLTLYGVSNLLKESESTLDLLDPHHWRSREALWRVALDGGAFEFPRHKERTSFDSSRTEGESDLNTITNTDIDYNLSNYYDYDVGGEPHPYAVKVPPPADFQYVPTNTKKEERIPETGSSGMFITTGRAEQLSHQQSDHRFTPFKNNVQQVSRTVTNIPHVSTPIVEPSSGIRGERHSQLIRKDSGSASYPYERGISNSYSQRQPILYTILKK